MEYLGGFGLRSIQVEGVALHMQLLGHGEAKAMRKPRSTKVKPVKTVKKRKEEEPKVVADVEGDEESDSEASKAVVPKHKDRHMDEEEYKRILALETGRKTRKKKGEMKGNVG